VPDGLLVGATDGAVRRAEQAALRAAHPDKGGSSGEFGRVRAIFARLGRRAAAGGSSAPRSGVLLTGRAGAAAWAFERLDYWSAAQDHGAPEGYAWCANPQRDGRYSCSVAECEGALRLFAGAGGADVLLCDRHRMAHACTSGLCYTAGTFCPFAVTWAASRAPAAAVGGGGEATWRCLVDAREKQVWGRGWTSILEVHICTASQCASRAAGAACAISTKTSGVLNRPPSS